VRWPHHGPSGRHEPSPALRQLIELLWTKPAAPRVRVTWGGDAPTGEGWTVAETYVALPSASRARFVVPLGSRRAAVGSVVRYNRLRATPTRLARLASAAVLGAHAERLSRGTIIRVWRDTDAESARADTLTLRDHLELVLDRDDLHLAFGVHVLDPNYKPTLQVFDRHGSPVAFVKVGWTVPTRRLVANEARAVRQLGARVREGGAMAVPRLLAETSWAGTCMTVLAPLPRSVRRFRGDAAASGPALAQVCGHVRVLEVRDSPWWHEATAALSAAFLSDETRRAMTDYVAALAATAGQLPMASWHGDWVPWNLATDGRTTHVFDLEHWAPCAPWGFDLAHWAFQTALVTGGASAAEAADAADASVASWPGAGVELPDGRYVVSLYLLELAARTVRLRADGGSWNERLFPDLFHLLPRRVHAGLR
jgi:hypothetical protein